MTDRNSASDNGNSSPQPVGSRRERYLVAPVDGAAPMAVGPMAAAEPGADQSLSDRVFAQLTADPATTVHRIIAPVVVPGGPQLTAMGLAAPAVAAYPRVAVVEMEADRAAMISTSPFIHVEPDLPLRREQ